MSNIKTYQEVDSSKFKNDSTIKEQVKSIEILLAEEIDTSKIDTFYGIKNEREIPSWTLDVKPTEEQPLKIFFNPTPIYVAVANWQITVLIFTVIILGITKAFSSNRFNQAIKSLFNFGLAQEIVREEKVFFHRSNVLFTIIHLLTTSLFLYHIKTLFNITYSENNNLLFFLMIIAFLMAVYFVKYIFSKILFFVLDDISISSEYIFNVSLYNNLLGVVYIPILCITYFSSLPFSSILLYIAIPLSLLIFLLRLIRLYIIGISKGISYFYIFLYICTLEILPLVVLFRIFIIK